MDLRFSFIGLLIGFLIGLTGMGGGSLMTPVMILVMGVKPIIAVGTDLAYSAVTKFIGGAAHWRAGTVHRKTAFFLAIGSVPATIFGVGVTSAIKRANPELVNVVLMHSIAWVLILVALVLVAKPVLTRVAQRLSSRASGDWRGDLLSLGEQHPWILTIIGAAVGFLVGLTSVGSGTLIMVSLLFLYPRWESKEWVGTDVFHAAVLVGAAGMAHFAAGDVNVPIMLSLLIGSVPGVLLGSRLVIGFPERALRLGLASMMLVAGSQLL
jgi:uncharacterized membrane protein YfcA